MTDEPDPDAPLNGLSPFKPGAVILPKIMRACASCDHSAKEGQDRVCRRYPPQVTFLAVPGKVMTRQGLQTGMQITPFTSFPIMRDDQNCGEFKRRGTE